MAVKTVTLRVEAYERLRAARAYPGESFSQVVMRARWADETITAGALLERLAHEAPLFSHAELDEMDAVLAEDRPPEDKWAT